MNRSRVFAAALLAQLPAMSKESAKAILHPAPRASSGAARPRVGFFGVMGMAAAVATPMGYR